MDQRLAIATGRRVGPEISDYVEVACDCIEPDLWVNLVAVFDTDVRALSFYREGTRV